ncbi:MAG: fimbrillin family protein [Muribaculaceae bacterium]|nr:fimbrillin family protein [Muribaculaceae bacterium]
MDTPYEPIEFSGFIKESSSVRTRALDSVYINSNDYGVDFYIRLDCASVPQYQETGVYEVPSGYEGRLTSKDTGAPLNWHDLSSPHTFYSWTLPWDPTWEPSDGVPESFEITFENSSESNGYDEYSNNKILEKFIGAKTGPYDYLNHGKYVDLTFFHLVSKIKIGTLSLIKTDGSIEKHLKADITFINMPTTATFYPVPSDPERGPYVEPGEPNPDNGITYYIDNDAVGTDVFYICPEVDFSTLDFKIKLNNAEYAGYDTYYGTFADVEFVRKSGNDYDIGDSDKYTLHAGEMMTLNITLIPGIGPGMRLIITDWSTEQPNESQYHSHPGIYSDSELQDLINAFTSQKDYNYPPEYIESLFEMYGEIGPDGTKYFPLFDNVTTSSNIFPVYKGYTIDGRGHTIYMNTNYGSNSHFGYSQRYYNIGSCRDIYLADLNGNYSIYIDSDGYVWLYNDETGDYDRTDNKLEPLEDPYKSYDISAETGTVHQSTYYNNSIVGS